MKHTFRHRTWVIVGAICVVAFGLRAAYTAKGLPYIHYIDEPFVANTALNMLKSGDLNPHWYSYGSLPLYLNLAVDVVHYVHLMGTPYGDEPFLENLSDLKIGYENGYLWTASHPSFYRWNRMLTCAFGAGTIAFVFMLALELFKSRALASIAALFLAFVPIHVEFSAYAGVDVPSTFFSTGCVYFSLLYLRRGATRWLAWALIMMTCAVATKYNAVICGLAPVCAIAYRQIASVEKPRPVHWLMLVLLPPVLFAIVMPYAIFDFGDFIKAAGYEVRHYKVIGHGRFTSAPGWEQFQYQLGQFWRQLGPFVSLLVLLGFGALATRRGFVFVMIVPLVGMAYMTQMSTNFHRNYILFYPFVAILFAAGFWLLTLVPKLMPAARRDGAGTVVRGAVWSGAVILLAYMVGAAVGDAFAASRHIETRTQAIDAITAMKNVDRVVVADELLIHEDDLRRLRYPRMRMGLEEIAKIDQPPPGTAFVVPAAVEPRPDSKHRADDRMLQTYITAFPPDAVVGRFGDAKLNVNGFNVDPGVLIVLLNPAPGPDGTPNDSAPREVLVDTVMWQAHVGPESPLELPLFHVARAPYIVTFDWTSTPDFAQGATIEVVLKDAQGTECVKQTDTREFGRYLVGTTVNRFSMEFSPASPGPVTLVVRIASTTGIDPDDGTDAVYLRNIELRPR